ncbi:MAG: hypothetical protein UR78_C0019G0018 [Candidatus Moranbacteria bacterium GW2011_GWF2_35_39]|nr:MAG: hypothetical protein UR78_C0019G0018 [Candidatus Moranbacteria bacterium GW2011_GWF2_35_39]
MEVEPPALGINPALIPNKDFLNKKKFPIKSPIGFNPLLHPVSARISAG